MTAPRTQRRAYAPRLAPAARREQVVETAWSLARERGFHAVTVDGVARAAGVSRPVVYALFEDRAQILGALVARAEQRAMSQLAPSLPSLPGPEGYVDPDALLVDAVSAYLSAVRDQPDTWRVVLLSPEGAPPELTGRLAAMRREVLSDLRALIDWAMERRGGAALDAELFARSVIALTEGAARLLLAQPDRYPVERFRAFTEDLLAGLLRA
jgi:AcrR family transcriptional regulator